MADPPALSVVDDRISHITLGQQHANHGLVPMVPRLGIAVR